MHSLGTTFLGPWLLLVTRETGGGPSGSQTPGTHLGGGVGSRGDEDLMRSCILPLGPSPSLGTGSAVLCLSCLCFILCSPLGCQSRGGGVEGHLFHARGRTQDPASESPPSGEDAL